MQSEIKDHQFKIFHNHEFKTKSHIQKYIESDNSSKLSDRYSIEFD